MLFAIAGVACLAWRFLPYWRCLSCSLLFAIAGVACLARRCLPLLALLVLLVVVCHCWRCFSCSALFTIAGVACLARRCLPLRSTLFAVAGVTCRARRCLPLLALLVVLGVVYHCWRCLSCSALFTIAGVACLAWRSLPLLALLVLLGVVYHCWRRSSCLAAFLWHVVLALVSVFFLTCFPFSCLPGDLFDDFWLVLGSLLGSIFLIFGHQNSLLFCTSFWDRFLIVFGMEF